MTLHFDPNRPPNTVDAPMKLGGNISLRVHADGTLEVAPASRMPNYLIAVTLVILFGNSFLAYLILRGSISPESWTWAFASLFGIIPAAILLTVWHYVQRRERRIGPLLRFDPRTEELTFPRLDVRIHKRDIRCLAWAERMVPHPRDRSEWTDVSQLLVVVEGTNAPIVLCQSPAFWSGVEGLSRRLGRILGVPVTRLNLQSPQEPKRPPSAAVRS